MGGMGAQSLDVCACPDSGACLSNSKGEDSAHAGGYRGEGYNMTI